MLADNFSLQDYLKRIGFAGEAKADIQTLTHMMARQLYSVPFENLDVQAGKIVSLVPEHIVDKIIHRKRGGYCYEVNGLFAMALQALGINYRFVAARPMFYAVRRPKTHMAILAELNGEKWLCDLGFGSYGLREPFKITESESKQGSDSFRLSRPSERDYLLQALVEGEWANQYMFDEYAHEWIDFAPANYLNSTHPDAIFVQKPLIVLHSPEGRKILFGDVLKVINKGCIEKRTLREGEYESVLMEHFGLQPVRG